jgi:hypothetical protein
MMTTTTTNNTTTTTTTTNTNTNTPPSHLLHLLEKEKTEKEQEMEMEKAEVEEEEEERNMRAAKKRLRTAAEKEDGHVNARAARRVVAALQRKFAPRVAAAAREAHAAAREAAKAARAAAEAGLALQALDAELREATRMELGDDYTAEWYADGLGAHCVAIAERIESRSTDAAGAADRVAADAERIAAGAAALAASSAAADALIIILLLKHHRRYDHHMVCVCASALRARSARSAPLPFPSPLSSSLTPPSSPSPSRSVFTTNHCVSRTVSFPTQLVFSKTHLAAGNRESKYQGFNDHTFLAGRNPCRGCYKCAWSPQASNPSKFQNC